MDQALDWIRSKAIPLAGVTAGTGFADLAPLRGVIGDARIVSLGEATHGTREFFQLKHRLLEYCVAELGFTVFGIEANFPESLAVNGYVLHGRGDPADALASMRFWTWGTEEVLALIEWIRDWNRTHDRKVKFYGFDMQFSTVAALGLVDYLQRVAPELATACEAPLAPLAADFTATRFDKLSKSAQETAFASIERVLAAFARKRAGWIGTTSELEWHLSRMHAIVLEQAARLHADPTFAGRDVAMAENVRSLLEIEGPAAKIVLWAHNGHAARESGYFRDDNVPIPNMGSQLHRMFGHDHIVVGFGFNQGGFQAIAPRRGLVAHTVPSAPPGSLDATLAMAGTPLFLIDLRTAPTAGPVADWLAAKPKSRSIGSVYEIERDENFLHDSDPRRSFDVLAFVETTTAARANALGRRPPRPPSSSAPELAAAPVNLELAGTGGVPEGWTAPEAWRAHAHTVALGSERTPSGNPCVSIARSSAPWRWGDGHLDQSFSAAAWRGRRLRLRAVVRAQAHGPGTGGLLFIEVYPPPEKDAIWTRPVVAAIGRPTQSSQWEECAVEVDVPDNAHSIVIGLIMLGNGAGWFGDIKLETVESKPTS